MAFVFFRFAVIGLSAVLDEIHMGFDGGAGGLTDRGHLQGGR